MKIKLGLLLVSALIIASGCARKCPPCPVPSAIGSSGSYSSMDSSAPASNFNQAASPYEGSASRYVKK